MTDTSREGAIRDCNRLYRDPEYAEATVPVLLRQLDAARAEIAELRVQVEELTVGVGHLSAAGGEMGARAEAAEARVAELQKLLSLAHIELLSIAHPMVPTSAAYEAIDAALAKEPPRWTHRHYKGPLYRFMFVAQNSETREDMAIYQNDKGEFRARPLDMFNDTLPDGRKRFTAIEEPPR